MDQKSNYTKPADRRLGLSVPTSWTGSMVNKMHMNVNHEHHDLKGGLIGITQEELKIRHELEMEIERDIEEEIKDGIYHLALRLHRLYQHKKERTVSTTAIEKDDHHQKKKTISEININIKMEGGTKVEIKETKKEVPEKSPKPLSSKSETCMQKVTGNKKFDWVNTLRSSTSTSGTTNDHLRNPNPESAKRNGSRRGNVGVDKDSLELGWQY
ncbi:hypothetical protein FNV43_RR17499 [Rhamnella rubrinervis]|uniref:Uncharacterized protein n=1 Tax=Rhamnella rubrinervis TaxID=2594499 RepID=A0A8K0GUW8_9ROSA|nr:hypothetical protein FNV43_RR17499 [Rhamnella rubrinervis]